MKSAENKMEPLKCFCGKEMQYDPETGVWGCDDSVYVPPDAHFEDTHPRMLTHPFLWVFAACFTLVVILSFILPFTQFVLVIIAPIGLGTFYLGRWLEYMLQLEREGN